MSQMLNTRKTVPAQVIQLCILSCVKIPISKNALAEWIIQNIVHLQITTGYNLEDDRCECVALKDYKKNDQVKTASTGLCMCFLEKKDCVLKFPGRSSRKTTEKSCLNTVKFHAHIHFSHLPKA